MTHRHAEPFRILVLDEKDYGQTLASALRRHLPDLSWGAIRQRILGRHVEINGNLCLDPARRLTSKDVVKFWSQGRPKPIDSNDIKIVYADSHLVVIDKPAGVTSVRHFEERTMSNRRRQLQPTLEELVPHALTVWYQEQNPPANPKKRQRHGDAFRHQLEKNRVLAVHRLDRDTSGLMLFARTKLAAEALGKMFRTHAIDRRYWAVALGDVPSKTIESYLVRDIGGGRRGSVADSETPGAQRAVTHIRKLQQVSDCSLLECQLETGRTHQIRIHLAEAGHPLCGERLYQMRTSISELKETMPAPRQALHAFRLSFQHPMTQEKLDFRSGWPLDLQPWFNQLQQASIPSVSTQDQPPKDAGPS